MGETLCARKFHTQYLLGSFALFSILNNRVQKPLELGRTVGPPQLAAIISKIIIVPQTVFGFAHGVFYS